MTMTPEMDLLQRLRGAEAVKPTAPSEGSVVEKNLEKNDVEFRTPISIRNIFTHHDTHPVVMDFSLMRAFGLDWYSWEAETIYSEIQQSFQSQISEHAKAKIQAVKTLHVSHLPWESWQVFEKVIQALNNNIPRFDLMQAPALEQLYAGVDIIQTIRHEEFASEVKRYMAASVLHEDVFYVPAPLDFIQDEVAHPHWRCKDCHSEDSALFHDGICDTCSGKFDPENGLSMRPHPELSGRGRNTELLLRYDPTETEARWREVSAQETSKVQLEETAADVQVARLLVARDYMNIRRRQLFEQLMSLKSWLGADRGGSP